MAASVGIEMTEAVSFLKMDNGIQNKLQTDSKYVRFVRRKFQCIIIFLILFISFLEFLNVFIPKLSESNLNVLNDALYSMINQTKFNEQ